MEVTGEFEAWWNGLDAGEQDSVDFVVELLVREGPLLSYPYCSDIAGALYVFDPRRHAALREMPLHRLREARKLAQKQIAEAMHIDQSRVSKIERRTDVYVSTLRNFVTALGGELELVARFPDGQVKISSFSDGEFAATADD